MEKKEKLALIFGTLLGDGCLSKVGRASFISVTCNIHSDGPFMELVRDMMEDLRGKEVKLYRRLKYGKIEISFSDKNLFNTLKGLGFPIGKKGKNLVIPKSMNSHLHLVLKTYFATDGSLVITNNNGTLYPRIEFSSISKELLFQIKDFLSISGIKGSVYCSKKYSNGQNTLYRFQSNGKDNLDLFRNLIGFINPKHEQKYQGWLRNNGDGGI